MGSKVEYTCIEGFHLVGHATIECTADHTWSAVPGMCKGEYLKSKPYFNNHNKTQCDFSFALSTSLPASMCKMVSLAAGVKASPVKQFYDIGESVTLSCAEGGQLLGEASVICDPSLNFSPDPENIKCIPGTFDFTLLWCNWIAWDCCVIRCDCSICSQYFTGYKCRSFNCMYPQLSHQ